jgi:hypothetical protein
MVELLCTSMADGSLKIVDVCPSLDFQYKAALCSPHPEMACLCSVKSWRQSGSVLHTALIGESRTGLALELFYPTLLK